MIGWDDTHPGDTFVRMPERVHCDSRAKVKVLPILRVPHIRALPVRQYERRTSVHRQHVCVCLVEEGVRRLWYGRRILRVGDRGVAGAGGLREGRDWGGRV